MSMKPIKKATAVIGKYIDKQSGQEKSSYIRVGQLFQRDDGSLCMKMEAIPAGSAWNGWINFYDLDGEQIKKDAGLPPGEDIPF
jgi:hypothetical protein